MGYYQPNSIHKIITNSHIIPLSRKPQKRRLTQQQNTADKYKETAGTGKLFGI